MFNLLRPCVTTYSEYNKVLRELELSKFEAERLKHNYEQLVKSYHKRNGLAYCPYCSDSAIVVAFDLGNKAEECYGVICINSDCIASDIKPRYLSVSSAVDAWNNRKDYPKLDEE